MIKENRYKLQHIYIYKYKRSKERRQSWIGVCVGIHAGGSHESFEKREFCSQRRPSKLIGLIFRRGSDSSGRTLIGKLKNEPANVISYELSRFISDSVEILSQCCVAVRWKFQDSFAFGYSWLV